MTAAGAPVDPGPGMAVTLDRGLAQGLTVIARLLQGEIDRTASLLSWFAERLSGQVQEEAQAAVNRRLEQLRTALQVTEELVRDAG